MELWTESDAGVFSLGEFVHDLRKNSSRTKQTFLMELILGSTHNFVHETIFSHKQVVPMGRNLPVVTFTLRIIRNRNTSLLQTDRQF